MTKASPLLLPALLTVLFVPAHAHATTPAGRQVARLVRQNYADALTETAGRLVFLGQIVSNPGKAAADNRDHTRFLIEHPVDHALDHVEGALRAASAGRIAKAYSILLGGTPDREPRQDAWDAARKQGR